MMKPCMFLSLFALTSVMAHGGQPYLAVPHEVPGLTEASSVSQPNFVYILVDDMGYGDVNLGIEALDRFKNPYIQTPNLARLASQSIVFTDHYASSPVCSPSRAGLLTGRTPTRTNINRWITDTKEDGVYFLRGEEVTIAELLKEAGYETAIFGKWHLNGANWEVQENWTQSPTGSFPGQQGFDYGLVSKENPHETRALKVNTQDNPGDFFDLNGNPLGTIEGWTSQIITDTAMEWLADKRDKEKPFFLYLPYDAVHERVENPEQFTSLYNTGIKKKDLYYGNVTQVDHHIGRLLDGLANLNLDENTIVFFSSDNGPEVESVYHGAVRSFGTSYPLVGQKRQLEEGGIRVPGMIRWTGKIKPRVSDLPNSTLDVLPTICEMAGVQPPRDRELDGTSILGHLLADREVNRAKPLYWQYEFPMDFPLLNKGGYNQRYKGEVRLTNTPRPQVSVRQGNYVLRGIMTGRQFAFPTEFVLFDVVNDPAENNDLSSVKSELFEELKDKMKVIHTSANAERQLEQVVKISPPLPDIAYEDHRISQTKCRVLVTTDIQAKEPDDTQSVVRLLLYANEYDIEGIIAGTSIWNRNNVQEWRIHPIIDAYEASYTNLIAHANGFPTAAYLRSVTGSGIGRYGMAAVGDGKDTAGTRHIESVLTDPDPRPIYVGLWGGGNSLAQALWDLRKEKTPPEMDAIISKMRVFDISGQDDAGAWMAKNFPAMIILRQQRQFKGMSPHFSRPTDNVGDLTCTTESWISSNVQSHGPLGAEYPMHKYIMEGDSPHFLYVIRNGLSDPEQWWHGGWGGRFNASETRNLRGNTTSGKAHLLDEGRFDDYSMHEDASDVWTYNGTTYIGDDAKKAAVARWRPAFQNDMAARMDWSISSSYGGANHNPVAICNSTSGIDYVSIAAEPGKTVKLSAAGSIDPDGDTLSYRWWYYEEPSTYSGSVTINNSGSQAASVVIPEDSPGSEIHVILEVHDNGSPSLISYRRVVIDVVDPTLNSAASQSSSGHGGKASRALDGR